MTRPLATRAQGVNGAGSRTYTPEDVRRVAAVLPEHPNGLTIDQLAQRLPGMGGRTIRAILAEHDGDLWLLTADGGGYAKASVPDDGEAFTRSLRSRLGALSVRIARREQYGVKLVRRQLALPLGTEAA